VTTKLEGPLKRELHVLGKPYTLTLSPEGFNLAPKGRRKGYELAWADLVSGDAALATALNASLARGPKLETVSVKPKRPKPAVVTKPAAASKRAAATKPAANEPPAESKAKRLKLVPSGAERVRQESKKSR
jgi:hypothetical protein